MDRALYEQLLAAALGDAALSQFENHQILWRDVEDETYAVIGVVSGGLGYYAIAHDAAPPGIEAARRQRGRLEGRETPGDA